MRRPAAVTLVVAAALIAGCGGGGNGDKEKIESTVHDYFNAFADGDPAKACDQLDPNVRDQIAKAAHKNDCEGAIVVALQRPDIKRYQSQLRKVRVVSVDITGDKATAKVQAIGATTSVPLHKEGGDWKIEGNVGETD